MSDIVSREPVEWLNYRGHVQIDPASPMGPNTIGESLWPVVVQYDADSDRSRVGLSYIAPTEVAS